MRKDNVIMKKEHIGGEESNWQSDRCEAEKWGGEDELQVENMVEDNT